ncbi:MAG: hypothetical protein H7840_02015 [Alphaproteobacteria bacterium]
MPPPAYDFDRHLAEMLRWEAEAGEAAFQLSGWTNPPDEVAIPWEFLNNIWKSSLSYVNEYVENEAAIKFLDGEQFLGRPERFLILPNATTALHLAIASAVDVWNVKCVGIVHPAYFAVGEICSSLGLSQINANIDSWADGGLAIADPFVTMDALSEVDLIVLTTPMYGAGLDLSMFASDMLAHGRKLNKCFLIDAVYEGMQLTKSSNSSNVFFRQFSDTCPRTLYVHSPSKVLFLNGAKAAVLTGDENAIIKANEIRNIKAGTVTAFQALLIQALSSSQLPRNVADAMGQNIEKVRGNLDALSVLAASRGWRTVESMVGIHTVVFDPSKVLSLKDLTDFGLRLLRASGVFAVPLAGLGYCQDAPMGYRVNLAANWSSISAAFLRLAEFHANF